MFAIFRSRDSPSDEEIFELINEIILLLDKFKEFEAFGCSLSKEYEQIIENNDVSIDLLRRGNQIANELDSDNKEKSQILKIIRSRITLEKKQLLAPITESMKADFKILQDLRKTKDLYSLGLCQVIEKSNTLGRKEAFQYFFNLDFNQKSTTNIRQLGNYDFENANESFRKLNLASVMHIIDYKKKYFDTYLKIEEQQQICKGFNQKIKNIYNEKRVPIPDNIQSEINFVSSQLPPKHDFDSLEMNAWILSSELDVTKLLDEMANYLLKAIDYLSEIRKLDKEYNHKKRILEQFLIEAQKNLLNKNS